MRFIRPTSLRLRSVALLSALALSFSCSGDSNGPVACTDSVTLSVSDAAAPEISWRPSCMVSWIQVTQYLGGGAPIWRVFSADSSNSLEPSLTFGQAPAGTIMTGSLVPLDTGVTYVASVFLRDGPGSYGIIGTVQFTR